MTFKEILKEVRSWFRNLRYSTGAANLTTWGDAIKRVEEWLHNVTGDYLTPAQRDGLWNAYRIY